MTDFKTDTTALRVIMAEKGINTIEKLSSESMVNPKTLGSILNGNAQPSSSVMFRIIDALSIEPGKAGEIFFSKKHT